jgi:hypothetical protein
VHLVSFIIRKFVCYFIYLIGFGFLTNEVLLHKAVSGLDLCLFYVFFLGNSPASEFCMPTFRNTLSVPSS